MIVLFLDHCKMVKDHISKIFEGCATLEKNFSYPTANIMEGHMVYKKDDLVPMNLSPQLKIFVLEHPHATFGQIDASLCSTLLFASLTSNSKIKSFTRL
jgi:hypothetical protein